jgi:small basic protein
MDAARLQPALLGGVFIGVMSALPIINAGNCCCCLWVLAGGALAVYLRQQNSPVAITAAEGALMGLLAGAIGGVIGVLLSVPIHMMFGPMQQDWMNRIMEGNEDMPPEVRRMLERWTAGSAMFVVGAVMNIVTSVIFGMLGGLLGVAIFKKSAPPPPPGTIIPHDPGMAQ